MDGLRTMKKAAISQAIVDAAMELFRNRPFDDVSVDEIATAAGIGRRTFFRYFPTKADVLLDRRRIDRDYLAGAIRARQPGEDDVTLVMRVLVEVQRRGFAMFRPEHQVELHRLSHTEPELMARAWLLLQEVRDTVVEALVGPDAGSSEVLRARVLAGACVMAVDTAITTWIDRGMLGDKGEIMTEGARHLRRGFGSEHKRARICRPRPGTGGVSSCAGRSR